jgi:chemotaxis protein CheX
MMAWRNKQPEWIARLDSAVSEVFEMMLARDCLPAERSGSISPCISARILFSGAICGECVLFASESVAQVTANALLGQTSAPGDPMTVDAIGELCNMIAGGWKSKLGSDEAGCAISPPSVSIHNSGIEVSSECGFQRFYSFEGNVFGVHMNF